jgi:hypothetical protein
MTEHPIIFSCQMVRAILDGRKTQTRRLVKPQPLSPEVAPHCENGWWMWRVWTPDSAKHGFPSVRTGDRRCPYGVARDRLWGRETFTTNGPGKIDYRADGEPACAYRIRWMPAIHMPRWACRLLLDVVSVRVERLQEISGTDARAEGIDEEDYPPPPDDQEYRFDYRAGYAQLWDSLNAKRAPWSSNPWVWVVEFNRAA